MKFIKMMIICFLLVSVANAQSAFDIRWGTDLNSNMRSNTLKQWAENIEGRVGTGGYISLGTGTIWYVDSGVTLEGDGSSWTDARNTLQEAVDASSADGGDNRGDIICVAQGHSEAVATAAAIDIDVAGLTIFGAGNGEDQPEFQLSANLSTFQVSAADVTLINLRFLSTKTAGGVAQGIDVTADGDGFRMVACDMRETSADTEFTKALNLTADADECVIIGNRFVFFTGGSDSVAITLEGGSDQTIIENNYFQGDWSGYVIDGSAAQSLNLLVKDNTIHNIDTTQGYTMAFETTTTGSIIGNKCYGNGSSFAIVADAMFVSPDNVAMQTEDEEVRNFETMFGAFSGDGGALQDDSIKASLDLAHTDLDSIITSVAGGFFGTATTTTDTTTTTDNTMTGFHDEYFNTDWVLVVLHDAGNGQAAPEGEIVDITDYDQSTGVFTHAALTAATNTGDLFWVARLEDFLVDGHALPTSLVTGSLATFVATGPGSSALGTDLGVDNSIIDVLGSDGVTTTGADAGSLLGAIGTNEAAADTPFSSSTAESDRDGSLIERSELLISLLLTGTPALSAPAASRSILDILGSDGTTTTGALAGSILGAIGTNETAANTPFSSATVEADADGSVLERLEQVDTDTSSILADTGTDGVVVNATGMADNTIDAGAIATDAITSAKIATDAIGAAELAADSHTSSEMATDCFGADELAADGVIEIGLGVSATHTTGNIYYVDASGDNTDGLTWATAKTSMTGGITLATASNDDILYVGPGFTENVDSAGAITMNKIGLRVIGIGDGALQPTLTWTNTSSSDMEIDNPCSFTNFSFDATSVDAMIGAIDIDAADVEFHDCGFIVADAGAQAAIMIQLDANADRLLIEDCFFAGGSNAGPTSVISFAGTAPDGVRIINTDFEADADNGLIYGTSTPTGLIIEDCDITNWDAAGLGVNFSSTATGIMKNCNVTTKAYTATIDQGSLTLFNVLWYDSDKPADNVGVPIVAANAIMATQIGDLDLAAIQAEVTTALEADLLEKLMSEVTADVADPVDIVATEVADNSVLAHIMSQDGNASSFERLTDSLEALGVNLNTILSSSGEVWYVDDAGTDSTYASSGYGVSWAKPFDTIDYALAAATENDGAVILVRAGHTTTLGDSQESYADAGITVIGMGVGENMSKIVFDNVNSSIDITASMTIINMWFESTTADTTIGLDIEDTADGTSIIGCLFTNDSGFEFLTAIDVKGGANRVTLENNRIINTGGAEALSAISSTDDVVDRWTVKGNYIYGKYDNAGIYSDDIDTLCMVRDNIVHNTESGDQAIEFTAATSTGSMIDNKCYTDSWAEMLDPGGLICSGNLGSIAADEQGIPIPISANSTTVTEEDDGSDYERLEWLQNKSEDILANLRSTGGSLGDVFYVDDAGTATQDGLTWYNAMTTLAAGYALASAGDIVFVGPQHAESVDTVALATAGVHVIGLSHGNIRPTITMNATGDTFDVGAADNIFENLRFNSTTADTTICIDIEDAADGCIVRNCEFTNASGNEFLTAIDVKGGADRVTLENNTIINTGGADALAAIGCTDDVCDRLVIRGNTIIGKYDSASIVCTQINTLGLIEDNDVYNDETGIHAIEFSTTATGRINNNRLRTDSYKYMLDPGSMSTFGNTQSIGIDQAAIDVPLVPGKTYSMSMANTTLGDTDLFEVIGGPISITGFVGYVVTVVEASAITATILLDHATDDYSFSTAVDMQSFARGSRVVFSSASPAVLAELGLAAGAGITGFGDYTWYCAPGMIEVSDSDDTTPTGAITWYMTFHTLADGVIVDPK